MSTTILILLIITLYLNSVAMYHLFNSDAASAKQTKIQLLLIWLLPLFGAVIIFSFHFSESGYIKKEKLKKSLRSRIINLLTFVTFVGGYSGTGGISGGGESHDSSSDSGGGGSE